MKWATTILVFCVGLLLAVGMVMLYSATPGESYLKRQLLGLVIGGVLCVGCVLIDYRHLKKVSILGMGVAVTLLLLVFVPGLGVTTKGATRWIDLQVITFQPSELAKIALIIAVAHYADRYYRHMGEFRRGLLVPGAFIALIIGLIFIEPDRGTSILLAAVTGGMLLIAGVRWRCLMPLAVSAAAALAYSLLTDPLRMKRIRSWINLEENKMDGGYQAWQAMLALGSGGIFGRGLGDGRQKHGFVPEHHTDFIFSIVGEELGLLGTLLVLATFLAFFVAGIWIAWNARDRFGLYLGTGIVLLITMQALINIGVVTSALPNKGLPLPFIGFGGTNLMVMLMSIGILISIARHAVGDAGERWNQREDMAVP